ncbi:MAG: hypothetical protein Q8Q67_04195 [bacterium]|nr:hypothetical protein [bacterium]
MKPKVSLNEKEEEAIKIMANELKISPDNAEEVINRTLSLEAAEVHKHGLSKRFFARLKARGLGLDHYICSFTL